MKNLKILVVFFYITHMYVQAFENDLVFKLHFGTKTEMNNITPAQGMMVYNTTDKKVYYYDGVHWVGIDKVRVLEKTTNYTLQSSDDSAVLTFDSTSDVTLTIPSGLHIGFNISIYQINTGKVIISGDTGVSVKNRLSRFKTAGKDAGVGIVSTANNIYHLTGDLKK